MKMKNKLGIQLNVVRGIFLVTTLYIFLMAASFATIAPELLSVPTMQWFTFEAIEPIVLLILFGINFLFLLFVNQRMSNRAERLRKALKMQKSFLRI